MTGLDGDKLLALNHPAFKVKLQEIATLLGKEGEVLPSHLRKILPDDDHRRNSPEGYLPFVQVDAKLRKVLQSEPVTPEKIALHLGPATRECHDCYGNSRSEVCSISVHYTPQFQGRRNDLVIQSGR